MSLHVRVEWFLTGKAGVNTVHQTHLSGVCAACSRLLALRGCERQPPSARAASSILSPCCGPRRRSWEPSFKARSALATSSTLESLLEVYQIVRTACSVSMRICYAEQILVHTRARCPRGRGHSARFV